MRKALVIAAVVAGFVATFSVARATAPEPSPADVVDAQRKAALDELGHAPTPIAYDVAGPIQALLVKVDAALATDPLDVSGIDSASVDKITQYNAQYPRYPFHRFVRNALIDVGAGVAASDRNRLGRAADVMRGVLAAISLDVQVLAEARAAGDEDPSHVPVWANVDGFKTGYESVGDIPTPTGGSGGPTPTTTAP